jgi:hypothetical protein
LTGTLQYGIVAGSLPTNLSLNGNTGLISGTVGAGAATVAQRALVASVSNGTITRFQSFLWNVSPRIIIQPLDDQESVGGADPVSVPVIASSPEFPSGWGLSYTIIAGPAWAQVTQNAGTHTTYVTGAPPATAGDGGPYTITIKATDGTYSATQTFSWIVTSFVQVPELPDKPPKLSDIRYNEPFTIIHENYDAWIKGLKADYPDKFKNLDTIGTIGAGAVDGLLSDVRAHSVTQQYIDAVKMPNGTAEQRKARQAAIDKAVNQAAAISVLKALYSSDGLLKDRKYMENALDNSVKIDKWLGGDKKAADEKLQVAYIFYLRAIAKINALREYMDVQGNGIQYTLIDNEQNPKFDSSYQGFIGDCHYVAAIAGLGLARPNDLKAMVYEKSTKQGVPANSKVWKGQDTIFINWPNGIPRNQKAAKEQKLAPFALPELGYYAGAADGLWMTALDKAYITQTNPPRDYYTLLDQVVPKSFKEGDQIDNSLKLVVSPGAKVKLNINVAINSEKALYDTVKAAIDNKKVVTAGTFTLLPGLANRKGLVNRHAYTVIAYKPGRGPGGEWDGATFTVRNPWNDPTSDLGTTKDMSVTAFKKGFFAMAWEE